MFENIKVDLIYHKVPTDFEMEFNLCGCCRMRILSDKTSDNKTLIHSLARAVSRSRVIIITGGLFGEDGIINTVSTAVGKKLSVINNAQYGISSNEEISIIENSIPLISGSGYFGGCILESGPQTLILLTENKNIRKNIMQTLIHSYIVELYSNSSPSNENTLSNEENNQIENPSDSFSSIETDITPADEFTQPVDTFEENIEEAEDFSNEDSLQEETEPITSENTTSGDTQEDTPLEENFSEVSEFLDENPQNKEQTPNIDNELDQYSGMLFDSNDDELFEQETNANSYNLILEPNSEQEAVEIEDFDDCGLISQNDAIVDNFKKAFPFDITILIVSLILLGIAILIFVFTVYIPMRMGYSPIEYIKNIYNSLFP